jgi:hypothetical protein
MTQPQALQGTSEELAAHLQRLKGRKNLLLIIPVEESSEVHSAKTGRILEFGMFPQLRGLTEEDFKSAEWHEEEEALPYGGE